MKRFAIAVLLLAAVAPAARADLPPPPPPPPPGEAVAKVTLGTAAGFGVMGLALWIARRRRPAAA